MKNVWISAIQWIEYSPFEQLGARQIDLIKSG